ncbi:MAG TPA: prolipoprotein diacylglyceryl transferase, partial [Flavobacteriales bacterium]|nr:prolipoprotein diacylglyceryl transferase [Flavobacteriales bacterium]
MYPTIYHALLDLTGIDLPRLAFLNSFGFFVAIAFMFASWTLGLELRRKEGLGLLPSSTRTETIGLPASPLELFWQGLIGFILGWKGIFIITNSVEEIGDTKEFLLSAEGSWIGGLAVGALLVWLRWREKKKHQLSEPKTEEVKVLASEHGTNITLTAALWGFIGAKLFHWLENPDEFMRFIANPNAEGIMSGLTMYGGLIMAGAMVIRYFIKHRILAWQGADAAAPGVMLAYAVGRIGCQVSGDGDWGIVNNAP